MEQSLNEIVRRHEALRATLSAVDGELFQVIAPALNLRLTLIDLRDIVDATERETEAERIVTEEVERPFDLAKGPLFRSQLLRLSTDEHLLVLTMHHIVTDGWSLKILVKELTVLYDAFCNGNPSPLPELPIQYVDFAHWQSQWMQGEVLQQELSYWKERLKGAPEVTELPTDYPRPAVQNFQGASEPVVISNSLTQALKTLSKNQGVTLFMTLLAVFKTLLYRYTGQEDLVLGSPIAGRIRGDFENLIGLFINTLVLRTDLSGNPTFRELLRRVREVALDAYAHQEVPFEKLMEYLHLERSLSFTRLFQVTFVLQNTPESVLKLLGCTVSPLTIERETALFDLHLSLAEGDEGLHGTLSYRTDLFKRATIGRMIGRFEVLLHGIVADPDRPISTLPLLMETEKHQLLVEWNDTKKDYPKDKCIHQLFEDQVHRTPDAVAVVFEDRHMTYHELNATANRIALSLAERGIGRGSYVPFLMDRSIEVPIAMLAIMKTGAAFVPLDIRWPIAKIKQILEELNSEVILVNQTTPHGQAVVGCAFLPVNEQTAIAGACTKSNLDVDSGEPIYTIYTSGSTGKPKGAVVPHRGITNRFLWMNEFFGPSAAGAALQTTHHVYDSAIWQLFWPLINGGKTVIPAPGMETEAGYLAELIYSNEVTITDFVPSVFNTIVPQLVHDLSMQEKLKSLRTIIVGGEEITPSTTYAFMAQFPAVRVMNLYGPTEASIGCICYEVTGKEGGRIPIGRPISNVHALVLDKNKNLVPVGVAGELYVSGICLGLGYLNDKEKTKAAFIDNPFPEIPYDKLYKTGDLVRYLPDGNIDFLGRIDHQVKIRGFRIELGEIETVLSQHSAVRETVVLAREEVENPKSEIQDPKAPAKRLVAYVVPRQDTVATINELRSFLKEKLPEYMVPSVFVFLDALPLTPNGKVDRKALPAPDHSSLELDQSFVAPRTPVEEMLAGIWAKLLGVDRVGVRDNFFDLGGHSLLAVRLFFEIEKTFGKRPPLASLFQQATIEHLAHMICQNDAPPTALVPVQPQGSKIPFFCVHEFFGDVFCYMNFAHHLGQDQPFYALQPRGLDGMEEPLETVEAMAAYYIDTVRTVQPRGPYAVGGLCFGGVIAFEIAQQLRAQGEPVELVALLDSGISSKDSGFKWWARFLQNLPRDFHSWVSGSLQLTGAQWLDVVKIKTAVAKGRLGGVFRLSGGCNQPNEVPPRLKRLGDVLQFSERHHRVARAQYRALKSYRPQTYTGRLTLFRAGMQPFFSSHDPYKGWSRIAAGGIEVRNIPGNHLSMLQEPHVQVLAKELRECLETINKFKPQLEG
jgi:aspartate racemase